MKALIVPSLIVLLALRLSISAAQDTTETPAANDSAPKSSVDPSASEALPVFNPTPPPGLQAPRKKGESISRRGNARGAVIT